MFTRIKQGPVRFPGEAAASGNASLLLINEGTWRYAGPSVPLGRVDLVAFDTWKLREAADCEYVVVDSAGKATGEKKSVVRTMRDHTIVVYDRRTGKKLGTRSWTVKTPTCAHWIKTSTPGSHADVDESDLMAWAETFVTR
jgi:hypothetical protein